MKFVHTVEIAGFHCLRDGALFVRLFVWFSIMSAEEIGPDFDIGIFHNTDSDESRRFDTDENDVHPEASGVQTSTDDQTVARTTTNQQLTKLLGTNASPLTEAKPVKRRRRKCPRLSRNDSRSASRRSQDEVLPKRPS